MKDHMSSMGTDVPSAAIDDFAALSSDAFWELDDNLQFTWISKLIEQLVGIEPRDAIGKSPWELFDTDPRDDVWRRLRADFAARRPFQNSPYEFIDRHGCPRHCVISGKPYFDSRDRFEGFRGIIAERSNVSDGAEARYRDHFELSPISLLEEDWSGVKRCLDRLAEQGVDDLNDYFEAHPEFLVEAASKIKIVDVNRATLRDFKASDKSAFLTAFHERLSEEPFNNFGFRIAALAGGQSTLVSEARDRRADGSDLHLRITNHIPDANRNDWSRVLSAVEDISEKNAAEMALLESETRLKQSVRLARLGYVVWDKIAGRCLYCSDELAQIAGAPSAEALTAALSSYDAVRDIIHPDDLDAYDSTVADSNAELSSWETEFRIIRPDGDIRHLREISEPVLNDGGTLVRTNTVLHDITDQRRAEQASREYQESLKAFIDNVPSAISLKDTDSRYRLVNRVFEDLFGASNDEIRGKTPHDLFAKAVADFSLANDRAAVESGQPVESEETLVADDGERTLLTVKFPVRDNTGAITAIGGIYTDISERKQMEEALRDSNSRYQHLFDNTPIAILEEDWSRIKRLIDGLTAEGVTDLRRYFEETPDALAALPDLIVCLAFNQATVDLYRAESKAALWREIDALSASMSWKYFGGVLAELAEGKPFVFHESVDRTVDGADIWVNERINIPDEARDDWSRVVLTLEDVTQRKMSEQALHQSEERFRDFGQSASDWFWEMDDRLRYSFVSERGDSVSTDVSMWMIGKTREEVREADGDPEKWRAHHALIEAHEPFRDFQYKVKVRGEVTDVSVNGIPIFDEDGVFKGYRGSTSDITDRVRTQEVLLEREQQYRAIVEDQTDLICRYLPDGTFTFANDAYCRYFGQSADQLVGAKISPLIPDDDLEMVLEQLQSLDVDRPTITYEHRVVALGGEIRWQQWTDRALFDDAGSVVEYQSVGHDIHDRRIAEAALRDSEARLKRAQETTRIGSFIWDEVKDEVITRSDVIYDIYGVSRETAPTTFDQLVTLVHPDDRQRVRDTVTAAQAAREPFNEEYRIVRPDGEIRWINEVSEPEYDDHGRLIRSIGTCQDITERKLAEVALRDREIRLSHSASLAKLGHWVWDEVSDRYVYCSDELARIYGFSSPEAFLAHCSTRAGEVELLHPDDQVRVTDSIQQAIDAKINCDIEYRIVRRGGEVRHVHAISELVLDGNSEIVRSNGTLQDITERKQAEVALRDSEARYRQLFEGSPIGLWEDDWSFIKDIIDGLGTRSDEGWRDYFGSHEAQLAQLYDLAQQIHLNQATLDIYRAPSRQALRGMIGSGQALPDELPEFLETLMTFIGGQSSYVFESTERTYDGEEIVTRRNATIPPEHRENWSRVLYSIEDITEHRQTEEQLRQAQKLEAVGQLTGGIAHDFNNQLAVILGNLQMLEEDLPQDADMLDFVSRAIDATDRSAELTHRLLAFSRKQTLQPRQVDIAELAMGMIAMLQRSLGETIEIGTIFGPDPWQVMIDPGQLENVILNLAINARDAMPHGGRLEIRTANWLRGDASPVQPDDFAAEEGVLLTVSDTGTGMAPEVQARIFEPFFTTKEVGRGTGLGLSMVFGFVAQSDGQVHIDSAVGQGTTVTILLPRSTSGRSMAADAAVEPEPHGNGETILIVEDDGNLRKIATDMLGRLGYRILQAEDGASALAMLNETPEIALLFTDLVLPGGMNGVDLVEKAQQDRPQLKLLCATGYADDATVDRNRLASHIVVVEKPYRKSKLARTIRGILEQDAP
jgi:PAS domain S-box-containing protein